MTTSFLGFHRSAASGSTFAAKDRVSSQTLEGSFVTASREDVARAVELATSAFRPYRDLGGARRAEFLRAIAAQLEARRERIVPRAMAESGLPEARLNGELGRTCGQLRMFASIAEEGSWADVRIDPAQPDRKPAPAPDTRSMLRPLGPVAIFGASNFPLAFSVAGGDTASALAAGCPVVVKAHPAHPGTSEIAAEAIVEAAKATGMPEGVFSMLFDEGIAVGQALVSHPGIKAVGFTGSRRGGLALWRLANERHEPIPVYAEMGSVNPSVVLPGKLTEEFAAGLHASATMGVGQFCTNPGLVITVGPCEAFREAFAAKMASTPGCPMLTDAIGAAYLEGANALGEAVATLVKPTVVGAPSVFEVDAATFIRDARLQDEVFGPCTLLVSCRDKAEAVAAIRCLDGQLTGSIHGSDTDLAEAKDLADELEEKVGRLIVNQFPTGVEVNSSMVHGGPFPATTDSRTTSVGGRAILRWVRPVCYQNFPASLLPPELT
ncbi:MAG TPA: aldehyde dehydrogenase (NADP(+)) [Fimbriimonadaceae bacterium]|nr:aldehyde dehydrogenase (NADP(+)) [Fimbriimonadaceae bacterium]